MPTRILIVGAGAIGAFYGSRLSTVPGILVSALCRSNYAAVAKSGFRVTSPKYPTLEFRPEHVFSSAAAARQAEIAWDYLLVATKALPDVSDDSKLLDGLVEKGTSIVLVQNGLGVEEPYARRFPDATVLSAVTIASAAQPEHGVIQHNRWTRISVGPWLPHLDHGGSGARGEDMVAEERGTRFIDLLKKGGIADAETYDHAGLQFVRWHKIAINAAMNPSSVLSGGCGNQEMSLDEELREHLLGIMKEILETAPKVLGRPLPNTLAAPEKILESTRRNSSGSKPSMWGDWEKGAKMELEVILGNPIRMARDKGINMPRLQTMYALIKKAQENRDKKAQSRL